MNTFTPSKTMLQNYSLDKLSPKDEKQVELWLLDHPEAVDDLKLDLAFAQSLKNSPEPQNSPKESFGFLDWLMKPQFAAATALTLSISLGTGYWIGSSAEKNQIQPPIASVQSIPLEVTRSTNPTTYDANINLNTDTSVVLLEVDITPWLASDYDYYVAEIINNDITYEASATPTWDDTIETVIHPGSIANESIILRLYGSDSDATRTILNEYKIKINRK